MAYNNFYYAASLLNELYGIDLKDENFEEVGLIAFNHIGNKRTKLHKYCTLIDCKDNSVLLPCNADIIEAVTYNYEDHQSVSNIYRNGEPNSFNNETYIEGLKYDLSPNYISGKFAVFERVGDTLYFDRNYGKVNILYRGLILDDNGLPEITDKEALAIATYCAYITKFKEGLITSNANIILLANMLELKWYRQCDLARVPDHINQNDMNEILDVKTTWNRKSYNKSYKPLH